MFTYSGASGPGGGKAEKVKSEKVNLCGFYNKALGVYKGSAESLKRGVTSPVGQSSLGYHPTTATSGVWRWRVGGTVIIYNSGYLNNSRAGHRLWGNAGGQRGQGRFSRHRASPGVVPRGRGDETISPGFWFCAGSFQP